MRKLLILLMALLLPLSALFTRADEKNPTIKIPLKLEQGTKNVRSLIGCYIESTYYGVFSSIHTMLTENLGEVDVQVTNTNTGEFWMSSFDSSSEQQSFLQISGTPGNYFIEYITEYGDIYVGNFNIN